MSGKSLTLGVGLPDVHFTTAGAIVSSARVGVIARGLPVLAVSLAVDPLEVMGALGITIACSIFGSSLVGWEPVLGKLTRLKAAKRQTKGREAGSLDKADSH